MAASTLKWKLYGSAGSANRLAWWPVRFGSHELSLPDLLAGRVGGGPNGDVLRVGPAADRHQHLQVRVERLQLLELVEVPAQRLEAAVADPVDRLRRRERPSVVGVRVTGAVTLVRV